MVSRAIWASGGKAQARVSKHLGGWLHEARKEGRGRRGKEGAPRGSQSGGRVSVCLGGWLREAATVLGRGSAFCSLCFPGATCVASPVAFPAVLALGGCAMCAGGAGAKKSGTPVAGNPAFSWERLEVWCGLGAEGGAAAQEEDGSEAEGDERVGGRLGHGGGDAGGHEADVAVFGGFVERDLDVVACGGARVGVGKDTPAATPGLGVGPTAAAGVLSDVGGVVARGDEVEAGGVVGDPDVDGAGLAEVGDGEDKLPVACAGAVGPDVALVARGGGAVGVEGAVGPGVGAAEVVAGVGGEDGTLGGVVGDAAAAGGGVVVDVLVPVLGDGEPADPVAAVSGEGGEVVGKVGGWLRVVGAIGVQNRRGVVDGDCPTGSLCKY